MTNNIAVPKEVQDQIESTEKDLATVKAYAIATDIQYAGTADILKGIKGKINSLETARKLITQPLDTAKKAVMDLFRPALERLEDAERMLKNKMIEYQRELDKKAAIEQAKRDKEAREAQDKLNAKAEKAAAKGDIEKADALQAQAAATVAPVVEAPKPKVAGVNMVTRWTYRITDASLIPREYLIPNERTLQSLATGSKGSLAVPGIEFYSEQSISAGRK